MFVFAGACCLLTHIPDVAAACLGAAHAGSAFPAARNEEWGCCGQAQRACAADRMESFFRLAKAERRRKNCLSACFLCVAVLPLYCLALVVFFSLLLDFDVVAAQVASCFSFLWLWTLASSRSTPATPNKSNNSECRSSAQLQGGWGREH